MKSVGKLLVVLTAVLSGCGINSRQSFGDAFPDPAVLVTTTDPVAVRGKLADVAMPDDREHNEKLFAMLASCDAIDAAHLVLLVRSVSLPENIVCSTGEGRWCYPIRGKSDNAVVVDQLLDEGASKLRNVDAYWLGELIGISQSDATMMQLSRRFVPEVDDGSSHALNELLRGMPGSPARLPFLADYMVPENRLNGERGWHAFAKMSFDSDRATLLAALMRREEALSGERLVQVMKSFSFDAGRKQALEILVERAHPISAEVAHAAVATFSFDSGRGDAFATLAQRGATELAEEELVRFVKLCSFDAGRMQCVRLFASSLRGEPSLEGAEQLLRAFSFDSDRVKAVEALAERWLQLPADERRELLRSFSFDSNRKTASRYLDL